MGGWEARNSGTTTHSNEDLHDQLLGACGRGTFVTTERSIATGSSVIEVQDGSWLVIGDVLSAGVHGPLTVTSATDTTVTVSYTGTTFTLAAKDLLFRSDTAVREPIRLLREAVSASQARYLLAATQSRLYVSTGNANNFRLLADGLAAGVESVVRPQVAQLGDYVVFTNEIDPVLMWRIGSGPVTEGTEGYRLWSAFESYDLTGLGIRRAGVVSTWGGYVFLCDVTVSSDRYPSRIYWCDYNRPLEWAPGGESTAGYVDLGHGETVLALLPMGSGMRCYTDQAIYTVDFVGGDAVFLFRERYRGDDVLSFKHGIIDTGNVHLWLTQDSIAVLGEYDTTPQRIDWLHKASGLVFKGLDARLAKDLPVPLTVFGPVARELCDSLVMGYDSRRGDVWLSWPALSSGGVAPAGNTLTLVLNLHYGKASLVDHGFDAFTMSRSDSWDTVRDFLVSEGICDADVSLSTTTLLGYKEGYPQNVPESQTMLPDGTPLWNRAVTTGDHQHGEDDLDYPADEDAYIPTTCGTNLVDFCKTCFSDRDFLMSDSETWVILRSSPETLSRTLYSYEDDTPATFPAISDGSYTTAGYPTLLQTEASDQGTRADKLVRGLVVDFDAGNPTTPGNLRASLGISNSPHCLDWFGAAAAPLSCRRGSASDTTSPGVLRPARPASFPFHRAGAYIGWRLWVTGSDGSTSPVDCAVALNGQEAAVKAKSSTWRTA
jgi:hypothetical protein